MGLTILRMAKVGSWLSLFRKRANTSVLAALATLTLTIVGSGYLKEETLCLVLEKDDPREAPESG